MKIMYCRKDFSSMTSTTILDKIDVKFIPPTSADGKYVIKVSILVTILSFFVLRLLTVSVNVTKEDAYGELRQGRNVVSAMQTHMLKSSIN